MPELSVVMRGYDRRQVDELVARVEGTLGRAPLPGKPITLKEFGWIEFDIAVRGYDRFEVDGMMRTYRRELAALEGVELPDDLDEPDAGLGLILGSADEDTPDTPLFSEIRGEHSFPVRFRGYDRAQVNALIARIWGTLGRAPLNGLPVTREELNNPRLDVVLRGYDRPTVEEALGRYLRELLERR
ncbi:DivIVA domain-containing protein [Actinomadura rudentiformis]|uniref:DivIVA domain-containing protein n=1 Tax=Actinomadura rudentiformis TaxID=359158 RepID=UPI00178C66B4|nr:DivIVA domain-containing protein [Actinomadura rudentiformis]